METYEKYKYQLRWIESNLIQAIIQDNMADIIKWESRLHDIETLITRGTGRKNPVLFLCCFPYITGSVYARMRRAKHCSMNLYTGLIVCPYTGK